jgi:hypothetical protein
MAGGARALRCGAPVDSPEKVDRPQCQRPGSHAVGRSYTDRLPGSSEGNAAARQVCAAGIFRTTTSVTADETSISAAKPSVMDEPTNGAVKPDDCTGVPTPFELAGLPVGDVEHVYR